MHAFVLYYRQDKSNYLTAAVLDGLLVLLGLPASSIALSPSTGTSPFFKRAFVRRWAPAASIQRSCHQSVSLESSCCEGPTACESSEADNVGVGEQPPGPPLCARRH